ncbi:16S rRNA (guanine(966)-N(2))-methyltransferase RsmD [Dissulfurirhabdus thermomarina]|uniref:16S rRNA (Guanine(966)-N(2))-methyltransferase RsmD n=1 Tax=Dissulfurirhabdus thermomarina TaxID=1765737 RepID=A0A6N9TJT9_DISTH|nr:16S rRNA (guanine(966)-N(2))-methyltransferase RsmD [Dissulfurirhabdus thermomarina]NDY41348.1 16S rRNA (guanine(966)-N(2))-methyltransferase RsmD [Dissulfurirhabdus thermomarina]NMX23269.1 16S rRNA (guanine(966)-N(2))-methyltransferase RsmD [Dissulfurirhabdus thermomarina]
MRITGGAACGRRLSAPRGLSVRPTADRVREALFQVLTIRLHRPWAECRVLDLFAGSGALGIEALSRGAREAVFVDRSPAALGAIRRNLDRCGMADRGRLLRGDLGGRAAVLERACREAPFDVVLADPPYGRGLALSALQRVAAAGCLAPGGWMVVEEAAGAEFPGGLEGGAGAGLVLADTRRYGQTGLWFYRRPVPGMERNPAP